MYLNKTILFKKRGENASPTIQGKVISESGDHIVVIANGIQTSFDKNNIDIINIIVDSTTELNNNQNLLHE